MHATISHSALSLSVLRGGETKSCQDQIWHQGEAIRLVNERIGSVIRKERASGALIAAVACLAHFEVSVAHIFVDADGESCSEAILILCVGQMMRRAYECVRKHMSGLEILVDSLGGLQAIYDNGEVGRYVYWFVAW